MVGQHGTESINKAQFSDNTILGSWNADLFYFGGQKFLLFLNKKSIYSVTICNYKKTDTLTLKLLFMKALKEQCFWDDISIAEQQLRNHFSDFVLSTTDNDRSAIGSLNDLVYHAKASLHAGTPAVHFTENGVVFNMNKMPFATINSERPCIKFATLIS